jgi:hypothetical protein
MGWVNPRGRRRSRLPAPVRRVGKAAVRAYARATSRWRPLPEYLLIGAKRSGTTSMSRYLLEHPAVLPLFPSADRFPMADDVKGVHFFDAAPPRSVAWYRSWFAASWARNRAVARAGEPAVTGEATPYYLFHPRAAERAARVVPDARILVVLRDPVERAYSHWKEQRRNGVEPLDFDDALAAEPERLDGEEARILADPAYRSVAHEHLSYVAHGEYAPQLARWLVHYPRDSMLVVRAEDFYERPQDVFDDVLAFLGLRPHALERPEVWNAAIESPMSDATRDRLRAHFRPHNRALAELLGRDFGWDA